MNGKELVEAKFDMNKGNYIPNIYFEFEKGRALVFRNKIGDKIVYVPRNYIRGGFIREKNVAQDVKLMDYYSIPLYWIPRKKHY